MLEVLGIQKVISIDDEHLDDDSTYDPDRVVAMLQAGSLALDALVTDPILASVFTDPDGEVLDVDAAVDAVRAGVTEDTSRQLALMTARAADEDETPGVLDPEDATDVSIRPLLEQLFADHNYEALTLTEWNAAGGNAAIDGSVSTLVLVDRDFSHEGLAAEAGDQVVADLIRAGGGSVRACMLTHSTNTEADERQREQETGQAQQLAPGALVVLSKTGLRDEPIKFAAKFRRMLLLEHLAALRDIIGSALEAGLAASRARLENLNEFEMISMLGSAIEEGAHEPDHILRLLQADARRAIQDRVRPDGQTVDVIHPLHRALDVDFEPLGLQESDLGSIELAEMYDDGDFLARTAQSIEPGDVFQIVDANEVLAGRSPSSKHYLVLLAQPCDVVVRGTGERGKNVPSHMVLARVHRLKEKDLPQARKRENVLLPAFPSDVAGPRLIKLAEVVHVPVLALDLCVFDSDGYSRMVVGAATPTRASWAWSERHRKIQEELGQVIESAGALGLDELDEAKAVAVVRGLTGCLQLPSGSGKSVDSRISVQDKSLAFGLRRVARLNDAATRSLLIQATHHQGRPADEARLVDRPLSAARRRERSYEGGGA